MAFTRKSLCNDLTKLGLAPGDTVMVHASVRSVGPVYGGPDEIHCAIVDAVSPGGTMVMLVGAPDGFDDIGRPKTAPEDAAALRANMPAFDKHATRANRDVGTLAEFFRSWPGAAISDGVGVRMAARGAKAEWLMGEHTLLYPFGPGTPFEKLVKGGAKLLLLGSDHDEVTLMHYAETVADFSDKIVVKFEVPLMVQGNLAWVQAEEFDSSGGAHANWPDRFFALIVDDFIAKHEGTALCAHGRIGNSNSYLMDVPALIAHAVPIMERMARGDCTFPQTPARTET